MSNPSLTVLRPISRPAAPVLRLADMFAVWRQRRCLARLDAHLLADIGLSADAAASEAARPLWDVPRAWQRG